MDPLLPIKEGRKIIAWKRVGRCWTLFSEEFREPGMPHLIDIMGAPADLRRVAMVCGALGISLERYRGRKGDFGGMEGGITSADLQRLRPFLGKIGLPYRDVFDVILPADAA